MRVSIGDVKLYVDVDGVGLVIDGSSMRERPTLLMLHGGPGIDHTPFKQDFFAPLTRVAQVVYYDHRGNGRSDRGDPSDWKGHTSGSWPRLAPGHYFVLGDNRIHSCDSRTWGSVPRGSLIGPVMLTYWPPSQLSFR